MKSLTFSCLICALNLYFAQKLLRKAKFARGCQNCKKLLQTPKVAQKLPSTIGTGLPWRTWIRDTTILFFFSQLRRSSGKFVNSWKTEEMKWKLEIWNSANSLSTVAFSLPKGLVSNLGLKSLFTAPTQWGRTGSRKGARKLCWGWGETE